MKSYIESLSNNRYQFYLLADAIRIYYFYKNSAIQYTKDLDVNSLTKKNIKEIIINSKKEIQKLKKSIKPINGNIYSYNLIK